MKLTMTYLVLHYVLACLLSGLGSGARFLDGKRQRTFKQTLHNHMNVQYYADFDIGGQNISGIFDTGSFELLVRSTRCDHCAHPTPAYDHTKSSTYKENGTVTQHVFGSGPCQSVLGYETVSVGPLKAEGQAFWEIMAHRIAVLDTAKFAAIVGIGPNFAYGNKEQTLLMSYGIDEFSVCLQKPRGAPGYLTWGPTESLKKNQFATAKVHGKHHWATRLTDVSFKAPVKSADAKKGAKEAKEVSLPCGGAGCTAIIDSGTSLIAAPGMALMQLSQQIPAIKEDCSNLHDLPNLHFVIDGIDFTLPPQAYVMRITGALMEANDIWDILFFKPKLRKLDMCMPAFMQMDMMSEQGPVWILGMPFFRYYHTTFDRVNEQMHFAIAGPDCEPRPFSTNHSTSLVTFSARDSDPLEVEIDALVPPTLSGMIDYPYDNKGELSI
jgi:hypothetical protein